MWSCPVVDAWVFLDKYTAGVTPLSSQAEHSLASSRVPPQDLQNNLNINNLVWGLPLRLPPAIFCHWFWQLFSCKTRAEHTITLGKEARQLSATRCDTCSSLWRFDLNLASQIPSFLSRVLNLNSHVCQSHHRRVWRTSRSVSKTLARQALAPLEPSPARRRMSTSTMRWTTCTMNHLWTTRTETAASEWQT